MYEPAYYIHISGVVLLWAGGPPPQYLAQTIVKVGFEPRPPINETKGA